MNELVFLHLSDSSLPVGGFAYSSGLESIIEFGLCKDAEQILQYINDFAFQTLHFEFPFLHEFYHSNNVADLITCLNYYDATFTSSGMIEASINLGRNWLRFIDEVLERNDISDHIRLLLTKAVVAPHVLFIYAVTLKKLNITFEKLKLFYINSVIRDQVSAAIRLGAVGPQAGHYMQHAIHKTLGNILQEWQVIDYTASYKIGMLPDLGQMLHRNIYSKLFKN